MTLTNLPMGGSPSLEAPDYWWFSVRAELLKTVFSSYVRSTDLVLDVGSADGPSAQWLRERAHCVPIDIDPRGIGPGGVVCSLASLPFADGTFDVVAAFDVIEHIEDEKQALEEILRVLKPGGLLLASVPAYEWAWTSFDAINCHYRRYTRSRLSYSLASAGLQPIRLTHGFAGVFPIFALSRLATRMRERNRAPRCPAPGVLPPLPHVSSSKARILKIMSLLDRWALDSHDLPFGSSIIAIARKAN